MITALDTNVLYDIVLPNEQFYARSAQALRQHAAQGSLVLCPVVFSELSIQFLSLEECQLFLSENSIATDGFTTGALFSAGQAFREYKLRGGRRARILPDFLIGAHAAVQADQLLTRDQDFYRTAFPKLRMPGI